MRLGVVGLPGDHVFRQPTKIHSLSVSQGRVFRRLAVVSPPTRQLEETALQMLEPVTVHVYNFCV